MRAHVTRWVALATVVIAVACVHASSGAGARLTNRDLLTQDQMNVRHFNNAYEVVSELRSNWLLTRGPDSFSNPSEVKVYLDNVQLGGVETLKDITANTVTYIRHFDGPSATSRWGIGHGGGVIYVSTHPLTGDPPA